MAGIEQEAAVDGFERMQLEFECCSNAEVSATAADGPEEIGILRGACRQVTALGVDQIG